MGGKFGGKYRTLTLSGMGADMPTLTLFVYCFRRLLVVLFWFLSPHKLGEKYMLEEYMPNMSMYLLLYMHANDAKYKQSTAHRGMART